MGASVSESYRVRLVARNEGIEYRDEKDVYRFNVMLKDKTWKVVLPCSKGDYYQEHELTDEERDVALPRIKRFLESKRYFGIFGPSYPVIFEREEPLSPEMQKIRSRVAEYWQWRAKSDGR